MHNKMFRLCITVTIMAVLAVALSCAAQAKIVAISADTQVLALNDDGTVYAWGDNWNGQVGTGNWKYEGSIGKVGNPKYVVDPQKVSIENVTAISAGGGISLALKDDGTVWAWGQGRWGQLGYGGYESQFTPVQVKNLTNVTAIVAGGACYALKDDGTIWAWGDNRRGQVGDGTLENRSTPVQVKGLTDIVAIGEHGNYAIKKDGTVWAWGDNIYSVTLQADGSSIIIRGALGDSSKGDTVPTPFQVEGINNVKQITGPDPTLYVKDDGTVGGWGSNFFGGLGIGKEDNELRVPSVQAKIDNVKEISLSGNCIALTSDGTVWVWGKYIDNRAINGETGKGYGSGTPAKLEGLDHVVEVCSGNGCNFVLKDDGSIWGWGTSMYGALRSQGQKIADEFSPYASIAVNPVLVWGGPSSATTPGGEEQTSPSPSPGFGFNMMAVLGGMCIIASLIARAKR